MSAVPPDLSRSDVDHMAREIPPELDRWNWGAFLLNWIWGLGNRTYLALLMFVPLVNIVMPFVLGAKGSKWAWQNGQWTSAAHFKRVQRLWAVWGIVITATAFALSLGIAITGFLAVSSVLRGTVPFQLAEARLKANSEVATYLGTPIATGRVQGSITTRNDGGTADLNFPATGPKGSGKVEAKALREFNEWRITSLRLKIDGQDRIVDVVAPEPAATGPRLGHFRFSIPGTNVDRTTFSSADKKIMLSLDIHGAVIGTKIDAAWIANKRDDKGSDEKIIVSELVFDKDNIGKDVISFTITVNNGLPEGSYRVDTSVDGTVVKSTGFTVANK